MESLTLQIKALAQECGFSACGITRPQSLQGETDQLLSWLQRGHNASMHYMNNHIPLRTDPSALVEGTQSIIVVLLNYYTAAHQSPSSPLIARYAWAADYHYVVRKYLNTLLEKINALTPCHGRAFCDSAPLFERALAVRAGLGWIGKSGMLINPQLGSYCFIGELLVDIPLDPDEPLPDRCGTCERCLQACPTHALYAPHKLDANLCISYQTIENRTNDMPDAVATKSEKYLFGCDECVKVCPWNSKAQPTTIPELQPLPELMEMSATDWEKLTLGEFKRRFRHSPLQRAGYRKLKERLHQILAHPSSSSSQQ